MKIKILLYIIFSLIVSALYGQMGDMEFGKDPGDNMVEFNIANVKFTTEGADRYFECEVRAKKLGDWYDYSSGTKPTRGFTSYFANVVLNASYNLEVLSSNEDDVKFIWSGNWEDAEGPLYTNLFKDLQEIDGDYFLYYGWEGYDAEITPKVEPDNEYIVVGKFKWKLKPGATGKTGFKFRGMDDARGCGASSPRGILGVITTGNGDTLVPNENKPAAPVWAGGQEAICAVEFPTESFVYSIKEVPANADTCIWSLPAGAGEITYVNDTAVSIAWLQEGEHTLNVIASNSVGESDPVSMKVKVGLIPTATVAKKTFACGNSAGLIFSELTPAGTTNRWIASNNVQVTNPANVTVAGTYGFAMDNKGCKDTLFTEVKLGVTPEVIAQRVLGSCGTQVELVAAAKDSIGTVHWYSDVNCTTEVTNLKVTGVKGTPQYFWAKVIAAAGCESAVAKVTVEFGTRMNAEIPPIISQCTGIDPYVQLPVVSLGSDITATWYDPSGREIFNNKAEYGGGVYSLVLFDKVNNCHDTAYTRVQYAQPPVATLLPVITACDLSEAQLSYSDLSGGTATWLDASKRKLTGGDQNNLAVTEAGQYYLALAQVNDEGGFCTDTLSVQVEVNKEISNVVVPPVFTACGDKAYLKYEGGEGATTLQWMQSESVFLSAQNPFAVEKSGNAEENYFLKMVAGNCTDTLIPVTVKYNAQPEVFGLKTNVTACGTSPAVLSFTSISGGRAGWAITSGGTIKSEAKSYTVQWSDQDTVYRYLRLYANDKGTSSCDKEFKIRVVFNSKPRVEGLNTDITACADEAILKYDWVTAGTAVWTDKEGKELSALNPYTVKFGGGEDKNIVYNLKIKDGSDACTTTIPVTVQYNTMPGVIVRDQTSCSANHTLVAECTGGTLVWLNDKGTTVIPPKVTDGSGIKYYKVYADGGECSSDTATFSVTYNTKPVVTVADETSCGVEHHFMAQTTDGVLTWLDGEGKKQIENPVQGLANGVVPYKVFADGGSASCMSDTVDFTVTYGADPVVTVENQTSCDLAHVLTARTTAGNLKWLNNAGKNISRLVSVTEKGIKQYQVYAEDGTCKSTPVAFTVDFGIAPKVDVKDQTACGNTHTLVATTTGGTLKWYNNSDAPIAANVTMGSNAVEHYQVLAEEGSCTSEKTDFTVTFNADAPVVTVEDQSTCVLSYMPEASTTGGTLQWYLADGTSKADLPLTGGSGETKHYKVKAVGDGCKSESGMQSFTVTFGTKPTVTVENQTACGKSHILTATAMGANLVWLDKNNKVISPEVTVETLPTIETYKVVAGGGACLSDTAIVTVQFGTSPVITVEDQTTCALSFMPEAVTTDGELQWYLADGITEATLPLTGNANKTQYYKVKAGSGDCSSEAAFSVTFGTKPVVTVVKNQTSCSTTEPYTLQAKTTSGNLKWLEGNTLISSVVPAATGVKNYKVFAEESGCVSDTTDFSVTFGARPTVTVADQTTCSNASYKMLAECSGGTPVWLEAKTSKVVNNPITKGSDKLHHYRVVVKDGDCVSDTAAFSVSFGTQPTINVKDQTACGLTHTLKATVSGGNLVWLDKGGNKIGSAVTAAAEGDVIIYKAYADGGSCKSETVEFTVTFGTTPIVTVEPQTTCSLDSYTLKAETTDGTLVWYDDKGTLLPSNIVKAPEGGGVVAYQVAAMGEECQSESEKVPFTVTFGTRPIVTVEPQTACMTTHTLVAKTTGGTLKWLNDKDELISPQIMGATGTVNYRVYADGGSATCVSDTTNFSVTYGALPIVTVENQTTCDSVIMLVAKTSAGKLSWYDKGVEITNPLIVSAATTVGNYTVKATDGSCVSDEMPFTVSFGTKPIVTVANQTSCSADYMLDAKTSGGQLVWMKEGQKTSPVITGGSGTVAYQVYADGGSCKSDTLDFTVTFGVVPQVTVASQTTCKVSDTYALEATSTGGMLKWYDADGTSLASNIVSVEDGKTKYYQVNAVDGDCEGEKIPFSVTFGAKPVVTVEDQTSCLLTHTLIASATDGTLKWFRGNVEVTNPVTEVTGTTEVKYKVVAEAGVRCSSDTTEFIVRYGASPEVTVSDITSCGSPVILTAKTTGGTLKWYDATGGNEILSPVTAREGETVGNYQVQAVDATCKSVMKPFTVNFNTKPIVEVKDQTSCTTTHTLVAETSAGNLVWLNSIGEKISASVTGNLNAAEQYKVYAESGGCTSDTLSFTVTFGTKPIVTVASQTACEAPYRLVAETTDGELVWWNKDGSTELPSNLISGTEATGTQFYMVSAKGEGDNCESEKLPFSVTFGTKPTVSVEPQTSCATTYTLQATATGGSLKWLDRKKKPTTQTVTAASSAPGYAEKYYVFAQGNSQACSSDTAEFTVTYGVAPTVIVENQSTCETSLMLKAKKSGGKLVWWDAAGENKITNPVTVLNIPTTVNYMVQGVDGTCEGEKIPFSIDFGAKPTVVVSDQTSCDGDHTFVASASSGSLVWLNAAGEMIPETVTGHATSGENASEYYQVYADGGSGCKSDTVGFTVTYGADPVVTVKNGVACGTSYVLSAETTGGSLKWYSDAEAKNEVANLTVIGVAGETQTYFVRAEDGACTGELNRMSVSFGTRPTVKVSDQTSCDLTHTLVAEATGGSLKWLKGTAQIAQTQTVAVAGAVDYRVFADGGSCQSDTLNFTVEYGANPRITVKADQTVCGTTYKLDATTTAGEFMWYEGTTEISNPVTITESGKVTKQYKLQAVDGTCISEEVPFSVTFNTKPTVKVFDQTTCGTQLTLFAETTGGNLMWLKENNEVTSTQVTGAVGETAVYKVYATAGCTSDTVAFNVAFGANPYAIGLPEVATSCDKTEGKLFFERLSDAKATYQWLDASKNLIIGSTNPLTVTKEGMYYLEISGTEGCKSVTSIEILFDSKPLANGMPDTITSCTKVAELFFDNLTASGATYSWYKSKDGSGTSLGNTNPLQVTVGGDYSLKITDPMGCSNKIPVYVKLETAPIPVGLPKVVSSCGGTEAELSFTLSDRNATFEWWFKESSSGSKNPFVVTEGGDYTLKIQGKGCATEASYNVKVDIGGTKLIANAGVDQTVLTGGDAQLFATAEGGTAPYKYTWKYKNSLLKDNDTIQAPKTVALTENTDFYLLVKDAAGCQSAEDTVSVKITGNAFRLKATARPATICLKNTSQLNVVLEGTAGGELTYSWIGEGLSTMITENPVFTPKKAGKYRFAVTVTDTKNTSLALVDVVVGDGQAPVLSLDMPTSCVGDTLYVENTNTDVEVSGYKWFLDGTSVSEKDYYALTAVGKHTLKVVGNITGGCTSDTLTLDTDIGTGAKLKWETMPPTEVTAGQAIAGKVGIETEGEAPYAYTWLSPDDLTSFDTPEFEIGSAAGFAYDFAVFVTDAKGCISDTLTTLTKVKSAGQLELVLTVDGQVICRNGVALLTATIGKAATAPYKFEWFKEGVALPLQSVTTSNMSDNFVVAYADAGKYKVQVSDSKEGGMSTDYKDVELTQNAGETAPVVEAVKELTILSGASTVLLAEATGGNVTDWYWSPADKLVANEDKMQYPRTVALTAGQQYEVFAKAGECVSAADTTMVKVDANGFLVNVTKDTTVCIGNSVPLDVWVTGKNTTGLTYEWNIGGTITTGKTATFKATTSGVQAAMVKVKNGDVLVGAGRVDITVRDAKAPAFDLVAQSKACQNDTVKINYAADATKAVSYEWKVKGVVTTEKRDFYVLAAEPGSYKLEVTGYSAEGCTSDSDTMTVKIGTAPVIEKLALRDSCDRAVVEVTAKHATNYTWTSLSGVVGIQNSKDKTQYLVNYPNEATRADSAFAVRVIVTSADGCKDSADYAGDVFQRPNVALNVKPISGVKKGDRIVAKASVGLGTSPYTYHWTQPIEKESQIDSMVVDPTVDAIYTFQVYVVDQNGCPSDTVTKEAPVAGGERRITLASEYGDVCQGGAAILSVKASGFGARCNLELRDKVSNTTIRKKLNVLNKDTLWVYPTATTTYEVIASMTSDVTMSAKGELEVEVNAGLQAPVISAGPTMTVLMNGTTVLMGSVVSGNVERWIWSPVGKLATPADTAYQFPLTAKLSANQNYMVFATDENGCLSKPSGTTVNIQKTAGFGVEITPQNKEICRNNILSLSVGVTEGKTTGKLTYVWTVPTDNGTLNRLDTALVDYTAPDVQGDYMVAAMVTNTSGLNAAARTMIKVSGDNGFNLDWGTDRMACVGDTLKVVSTEKNLNYIWKVNSVEVINGSDSVYVLTATGGNKVEVSAVRTSAGGCASNVLVKELNIGVAPVIDILQSPFAENKNVPFELNIVDGSTLTGDNTFAWTPDDKVDGVTTDVNMVAKPLIGDVRYVVTATSKYASACYSKDSVNVYLIPDAPAVKIENNTNSGNIKLTWGDIDGAEYYIVKSIDGDPYNLMGHGYQNVIKITDKKTLWAEPNMRSVVFYYVTAGRSVDGLGELESKTADTVGYVRHVVDSKDKSMGSIFNYIFPYVFEMEGLSTLDQLVDHFAKGKLLRKGNWDFEKQKYLLENYNERLATSTGCGWKVKQPLKVGESYLIGLKKDQELDFVLMGTLKSTKVNFSFKKKEGNENTSLFYLPFEYVDKINFDKLALEALTLSNIRSLGVWDYQKQTKALTNKGRDTKKPFPNKPGFDIKAGHTLLFQNVSGSYEW